MATTAKPVAGRLWGWTLFRAIIALLLGVAAIAWPLSAVFAFTLLFAAYAVVDGIASLVCGVRSAREGGRWGALAFRGITGILVGVVFLFMPFVAALAYALITVVLLAAWSIIAGIFEIAAAIRLRKEIEGEWLLGISGLISLLLGAAVLLLVIPNPAATILSAAWLIALYAFAVGAVLLFEAFSLRRLSR